MQKDWSYRYFTISQCNGFPVEMAFLDVTENVKTSEFLSSLTSFRYPSNESRPITDLMLYVIAYNERLCSYTATFVSLFCSSESEPDTDGEGGSMK